MEIKSINIVITPFMGDRIHVITDVPSPFEPNQEPLTMVFYAPFQEGKLYVEKYFPGVPFQIVDHTPVG